MSETERKTRSSKISTYTIICLLRKLALLSFIIMTTSTSMTAFAYIGFCGGQSFGPNPIGLFHGGEPSFLPGNPYGCASGFSYTYPGSHVDEYTIDLCTGWISPYCQGDTPESDCDESCVNNMCGSGSDTVVTADGRQGIKIDSFTMSCDVGYGATGFNRYNIYKLQCVVGQTLPCYDGPTGTAGVGICRAGSQTCIDGLWYTACQGEVTPQVQQCNGLDNDCDGQQDCECISGQTRHCYDGPSGTEGVGICQAGTQTCINGHWDSTCNGQVLPQPEICDGLDNNCNGLIDEGFECENGKTKACYSGPAGTENVGTCRGGLQVCIACQWDTACQNEVLPAQEKCDGQNHNCNDKINEGCDDCKDDSGKGTDGNK